VTVEEKSNEITSIPQLLDLIDLTGATVTIDAMGCQTGIASKIVQKKADYCLALKGNQANLHNYVKLYFDNFRKISTFVKREKGHGQIEKREYLLETDIRLLSFPPNHKSAFFEKYRFFTQKIEKNGCKTQN
jgi:predicted transposase YbfD/YdcC